MKPGSMIVVAGSPGGENLLWVIVKHVYGPIKGHGWLCDTEEGNLILVGQTDVLGQALTIFIINPQHQNALKWLVSKPHVQDDLPNFAKYLGKNFSKITPDQIHYYDKIKKHAKNYGMSPQKIKEILENPQLFGLVSEGKIEYQDLPPQLKGLTVEKYLLPTDDSHVLPPGLSDELKQQVKDFHEKMDKLLFNDQPLFKGITSVPPSDSKHPPLTFENLMKAWKDMQEKMAFNQQYMTDPGAWFVGVDWAKEESSDLMNYMAQMTEQFLKSRNRSISPGELSDLIEEEFAFLRENELDSFDSGDTK